MLAFEAVPETLARTSLGELAAARRVNLEDALRAGEPLGGHIVQGHVDGVGEIAGREREGDGHRAWCASAPEPCALPRREGLIAVAGVSLTVAALTDDGFEVALIPHTLQVDHVSANST